ncbi:MAG TPA: hypothetical protein VE954_25580 [Oligoflexus sp.]|uniref:hypothetical protein n=1 Tax=Oligoflexus sp. TaxID=1971216 RepID=UPI002D5F5C95|nr:hypothetical protein [Oligoflexus sp.]HYX36493.1 hypothetical protein [Oligoflexus sp.]
MSSLMKRIIWSVSVAFCMIATGCGKDEKSEKPVSSELSQSSQDIACLAALGSSAAWAKSCVASVACYVGAGLGGVATLIGCYDKTKINYYRSCVCVTNEFSPILEQDAYHITRKGKLICPNQPIGIPYDCKNTTDLREAG